VDAVEGVAQAALAAADDAAERGQRNRGLDVIAQVSLGAGDDFLRGRG
jgi:hypothetical protein